VLWDYGIGSSALNPVWEDFPEVVMFELRSERLRGNKLCRNEGRDLQGEETALVVKNHGEAP
jgi:hypothetical protein